MLTSESAALQAQVAARLVGFPGFLRANGFATGGGDAVPVLQAAQRVGVLDAHLLRWSLQALLCGRGDEWRRFDALFDAWFLPANRWQRAESRAADVAGSGQRSEGAARDCDAVDDGDEARPRWAASAREVLSSTDFGALTEREHMLDIEAL